MPSFETDSSSFFCLPDFPLQPDVDLTIARTHPGSGQPLMDYNLPITASEHRKSEYGAPFPNSEDIAMQKAPAPEEGDVPLPGSGGSGGDDGGDTPPPAGGEVPADDDKPFDAGSTAPDITTSEVIQRARARQILTTVNQVTHPYLGEKRYVEDKGGLFVPAQREDVYPCLQAAHPRPGEIFADLGSGDGRWVLTAAGALGLEAYGYELSAERHELAERALQTLTEKHILSPADQARVHLIQGDLFRADISQADVIAHYAGGYPPSRNIERMIEQKLVREGRDGARFILYGDGFEEHTITQLEPIVQEIPGTTIPTAIYRIRRS